MIFTGHMAVGTGVGLIVLSQTQDPQVAFPTAFLVGWLSHYVSDFIPHGHLISYADFSKKPPLLYIDLIGGGLLFTIPILFKLGFSMATITIMIAILGAQLPDLIEGLLFEKILLKKGLLKIENNFHQNMHWHGKYENGLKWDIRRDIWQVSLILITLYFLLTT